jgi:N-acetylglucosaminyldiphosphoundecaprenol N-acetyl-beta-D-mannosaminyltransferase
MRNSRVDIQGVPVDLFSKLEVLDQVTHWLTAGDRPRQIITLNALMLMGAVRDPRLNRIIQRADLITLDGQGILRALRKLGYLRLEQCTGIDLTRELLTWCARYRYPVYFYGGSPAAVAGLRRNIVLEWPDLPITAIRDGYRPAQTTPEIAAEILQNQPSLLLVALGSPTQEIFLAEWLPRCKGTVGIGVGGAFDILAGLKREAPRFVRTQGLEWLYRMIQEPAKFKRIPELIRFWGRYLR